VSGACPADYRTDVAALRGAAPLKAETLYVVGGLYGNPEALEAVLALRAREERSGGPVTLVFNGDFHWFDVDAAVYRRIGAAVLQHAALRGNVEAELARGGSADCGCDYPDYVERGVPQRSNAIFARLAATAATVATADPAQTARLAALPLQLAARVGGLRVAILHGDPESLAGWRLAEEALAGRPGVPQTAEAQLADWFRRADADVFAATHTCLPFAQDLAVDGRPRLIVNNGSAGMPNFRGLRCGLLTRISARPGVPEGSLYGTALGGVRCDALPIPYDHERWLRRFEADWPPGSPAHVSYHARIAEGPDYALGQAVRGTVRRGTVRRGTLRRGALRRTG
jgi:hypothetical protein